MSRHRIKSVAFDDDYLDDDEDYDEEYDEGTAQTGSDGLTDSDKEQLRLGTIEVRKHLDTENNFTDAEIQESLWHYYYDIAKAVAYLKNKRKPPVTKTPKNTESNGGVPILGYSQSAYSAGSNYCQESPFLADFFDDCPWFNVPQHRLAIIQPLSRPVKGGLLGGSSANDGKMSKLAALAAKRRQKENDKVGQTSKDVEPSGDDSYTARLKRLRLSSEQKAPKAQETTQRPKSIPNASPAASKTVEIPDAVPDSEHQHTRHPSQAMDEPADPIPPAAIVADGPPSAFASTLTRASGWISRPRQLPDSLFNFDSAYTSTGGNIAKGFDFTDPSPDDIVQNAQNSKAPKTKPTTKQNSGLTAQATISTDMRKLAVSEPPVSKSRGLDVIAEYKKSARKPAANFVVIGHVDAGKSTLMGRLLFDLEAVDQRTIDKYKRESEKIGKGSFAFAWVLDQGSEERARGVTIDIATNKFETVKTSFTILDAPGHQDFVPNMIAGASQADFAVLVIDASGGNFESGLKGQTKEHALLVRSMGVQRIIVAVNKMDAVDWSKQRFDEIMQQIGAFLTAAGFQEQNLSFVPCSGLQGDNILRKANTKAAAWYRGSTLVEELDNSEPTTHAIDKALRMPIADVFRGGVQNPLSISGRIEAGGLQVGEIALIMPSGESASIKAIEVDEIPNDWAVAGQNVILHLADIDPMHIKIGDVLCSVSSPIACNKSFTAKLLTFEHLTPMHLDVHKGRLHVSGRIVQLIATLDKSSGAVIKKKPKIVQPGSLVRAIVGLEQVVPLEAPSRVILRSEGRTVAAGLLEE